MRRAARVDENQAAIVQAATMAGAKVLNLSQLGQGVPDLLVCHHRRLALWEVKDGNKSPSRRKLTPAEKRWHEQWRDAPVRVVESVEDAIAALNEMVEG